MLTFSNFVFYFVVPFSPPRNFSAIPVVYSTLSARWNVMIRSPRAAQFHSLKPVNYHQKSHFGSAIHPKVHRYPVYKLC